MFLKPNLKIVSILTLLTLLCACATSSPKSTSNFEEQMTQNNKELQENLVLQLKSTKDEIVKEIKETLYQDLLTKIENTSTLPKGVLKKQRKAKLALKNKTIIGRIENIEIDNIGFTLKARIDTGAKTCSMHAENIVEKQVDGSDYIQFFSENTKGMRQSYYKKVIRKQKVKSSNGEVSVRYVVKMAIKLGGTLHEVNVNLNDREDLRYNFLIGRNLLMGQYVVDVSQSQILGK